MNRNAAIVLIVAIVAVAGAAVYIYREQHRNSVEISIGNGGVKVEGPAN
ncbi:hypothetical protein LMIY3S_03598 [Labrys miyagiensis]